jgi:hypothetical protein
MGHPYRNASNGKLVFDSKIPEGETYSPLNAAPTIGAAWSDEGLSQTH